MKQPKPADRLRAAQAASLPDTLRMMRTAAMHLSGDIRLASCLGKHALSKCGRRRAYQVKADKVSHCLTRLNRFFRVMRVEYRGPQWTLVIVRLADKSLVHVPWQHLSPKAQELVALSAPSSTNPNSRAASAMRRLEIVRHNTLSPQSLRSHSLFEGSKPTPECPRQMWPSPWKRPWLPFLRALKTPIRSALCRRCSARVTPALVISAVPPRATLTEGDSKWI